MTAIQRKFKVSLILLLLCLCTLAIYNKSMKQADIQKSLSKIQVDGKDQEVAFSADDVLEYQYGYKDLEDPGLASFIYKRWINLPSKQPRRKDFYKGSHFSQKQQDEFIDGLLDYRENGFYVECGAKEGVSLSNSLFFELHRNWTGLLIEAIPHFYHLLLQKKRNAYSINACLNGVNQTGVAKFAFGLNQYAIKEHHMPHEMQYEFDVQCFPLYALMLSMKRTHIDYFSLDIEGAELAVLKTIPFEKLQIDVLTIEYRYYDGHSIDIPRSIERLAELRKLFKGTELYEEVAILPQGSSDEKGLDIVFKRL